MSGPGAVEAYQAVRDVHRRADPDPGLRGRLERARRGIAGEHGDDGREATFDGSPCPKVDETS